MKGYVPFLVVVCLVIPVWSSFSGGPPEDGLDWIDNQRVPEPYEEGSSPWYTPSRRAHFYAEKYKRKLENQLKSAIKADDDLRLPTNVLPYRYSIQLVPFLEEGNFTTDGTMLIFVDCIRSTDNITLNSADITIQTITVIFTHLYSKLVIIIF